MTRSPGRHRAGAPRLADRGRPGLSVLELLVSLALLALIAGGLAGGLGLGVRLFERARAIDAPAPELALRTTLRGWLAAAAPPGQEDGAARGFVGEAQRMRFTTRARASFAPEAWALRVTVWAEEDALLLEAEALAPDGAVLAAYPGRLATGADDVRFTYHEGRGGDWTTRWDDPGALPALVRIEAAEGSTPPWPEMTVRPRLD